MSASRTIVIGGGANGLTAAALLARRGPVVLLERNTRLGGLCAGIEFHPGFRSPGLLHDPGRLRPWVADLLSLDRHGLRRRPEEILFVDSGGPPIAFSRDVARLAALLEQRNTGEGARYTAWRSRLDRFRSILAGFVDRPPVDLIRPESAPRLDTLRRLMELRRLGTGAMLEFLRLPPMSLHDLLTESLTDPLLCAGLALPPLAGGFAGPRSPGTAFDFLLHDATSEADIVGGAPALVAALEACARDAGVELRTGQTVAGIRLDDRGAVEGVVLEDGSSLDAGRVLATCSPRHALLDLLPDGVLSLDQRDHVDEFRHRGTTAYLLLALERPLQLPAAEHAVRAVLADRLDTIERAFDAAKYRELPEAPVLDVRISPRDAGQADGGGSVVSVAIHFVRHAESTARPGDAGDHLIRRVLDRLAGALPNFEESIVGSRLLFPEELERRYGLPGGQIHHGEHALDQRLVRPTPACSGYATPVPGLFLGGSGSHPGGGATCANGALAARRMG